MPLTRLQFELEIDDQIEHLMRQIYHQLAGGKDLAYSEIELRQLALGSDESSSGSSKFLRSLEVLQEIGAIEGREVLDQRFYAFLSECDTSSWQLKVHV